VPTTLLAMVDSAVGGKTGVNLPRGKNLAGAFWQPRSVACDTDLLTTLSTRAYRAAFAEIVKYAMISGDGLVGLLDTRLDQLLARDPEAVADAVRRSVVIKARVIVADERETGLRAILNYGHTVGHALEAATGFGQQLNHGEAIAAGMRGMGADKRVHSGSVGWVLLERRGSPRFGQLVPEETARAVLREMLA